MSTLTMSFEGSRKETAHVPSLAAPSLSFTFPTLDFAQKFGLIQVTSLPGGSKTRFVFAYLENILQKDPPPLNPSGHYYLFVSDEGMVYPPTLSQMNIPLSRLLIVKAREAPEVWKIGLEGIQTTLFRAIFLRPSRGCPATYLRKLQLYSERTKTQVFLLLQDPLPHWALKGTLKVGADYFQKEDRTYQLGAV